jgi:hypothetical protein
MARPFALVSEELRKTFSNHRGHGDTEESQRPLFSFKLRLRPVGFWWAGRSGCLCWPFVILREYGKGN